MVEIVCDDDAFFAHRIGGGKQIGHHNRHHAGGVRRRDAVI